MRLNVVLQTEEARLGHRADYVCYERSAWVQCQGQGIFNHARTKTSRHVPPAGLRQLLNNWSGDGGARGDTEVCFICPLGSCISFPRCYRKPACLAAEIHTKLWRWWKKNPCFLQPRSQGCLFIPPKRARGGGRSILGRYWCCKGGYLFLNPLAVDIPVIGEGSAGASPYSPAAPVTAALIKPGSDCSSWVHLLHNTNCDAVLTSVEPIYAKPQVGRVINFQIFEWSFWNVDLAQGFFFLSFNTSGHNVLFFFSFFRLRYKGCDWAVLRTCPCGLCDNWIASRTKDWERKDKRKKEAL